MACNLLSHKVVQKDMHTQLKRENPTQTMASFSTVAESWKVSMGAKLYSVLHLKLDVICIVPWQTLETKVRNVPFLE